MVIFFRWTVGYDETMASTMFGCWSRDDDDDDDDDVKLTAVSVS